MDPVIQQASRVGIASDCDLLWWPALPSYRQRRVLAPPLIPP
jgi:hypothetical protein